MDRKRITDEVIELLCAKLHRLPLPNDDPGFNYEGQVLIPEITDNELDIAEVAMDLEDAFGINFVERMPGDADLPTIGSLIDYIQAQFAESPGQAPSA